MILMGRKKNRQTVVSNIMSEMSGKGQSDEDLKYDPEKKEQKEDGNAMALEHAAKQIVDSISAGDVKNVEHALKSFIKLCLDSKD